MPLAELNHTKEDGWDVCLEAVLSENCIWKRQVVRLYEKHERVQVIPVDFNCHSNSFIAEHILSKKEQGGILHNKIAI